jgi:uncharacterized protein YkwD
VGNRGLFVRLALGGVLLLALAASSLAQAVTLTPQEQEIANRLTGDRGQRRSRGGMVLDPILTAVARARAADMAKRRYFSHVDPDGYGPNHLIRSAGYALPEFWGGGRSANFVESIGAGYATPFAAWDGWMRSTPHRTHLLAAKSFYREQTHFGVGFCFDQQSPYRSYWVVITAPPSRAANPELVREGRTPVRVAVQVPAQAPRRGAGRPDAAPAAFIPGVPRPTVKKNADPSASARER